MAEPAGQPGLVQYSAVQYSTVQYRAGTWYTPLRVRATASPVLPARVRRDTSTYSSTTTRILNSRLINILPQIIRREKVETTLFLLSAFLTQNVGN